MYSHRLVVAALLAAAASSRPAFAAPPAEATTIDQVIDRLGGIVRDSQRTGDRAGYFAALYNRVTLRVRDGIRRGEFQDNARMAKLDVIFANRFLAAYDTWKAGGQPTRAWRIAFAATRRKDLTVLQHLVLGMNAHINLDLGIAAARTAPGAAVAGIRGDFDKINDVLASLLPVVESETRRIDPLLGWVTALAHGEQDVIANRFIDEARNGAFKFAQKLAPLSADAQSKVIARRDWEMAALGEGLVLARPFAKLLAVGESADVRRNIGILAQGERLVARRRAATASAR